MKKSSISIGLILLFSVGSVALFAAITPNNDKDGVASMTSHDGPKTEPGLSYLKAKQEAEQKDMKYVLYFKADWCTPCKWMEETTFQDDRFLNAIDNTFIFVPLDIDAFEGYALKEYFQVYSLPTMLVFNDNHEIVNRAEGSLSATAFLELMSNNVERTAAPIKSRNEVVNTRPKQQTNTGQSTIQTAEQVENSDTKLSAEIIKSVTRYSVQLGAFSSYANAKAIQDKVSQYTSEGIQITTIPKGDVMIYKVFAGKLDHEEQAAQLQKTLHSYGMDGFVTTMVVSLKS